MKALIIGCGSIGQRHDEVLRNTGLFTAIDFVSGRKLDGRTAYSSLPEVNEIGSYDYFVIASETSKHHEQLVWLDSNVSGRTILCEKPLFADGSLPEIKNNRVFAGYVLRFHPVVQELRRILSGRSVISANVICASYLPHWRKDRDYRTTYSAKAAEGGGALLDLSHEIDYSLMLFGGFAEIRGMTAKVSKLETDSEDTVSIIGKTQSGGVVTMNMDYISRIPVRTILAHTDEFTVFADLIENRIEFCGQDGDDVVTDFIIERNEMFDAMHRDALAGGTLGCTYAEGLEVMKVIRTVQEQNR